MNKFMLALSLIFFPILALAGSSSLSFAPPPGDLSMIFLGNLFGIVDGVLHGTGSQIMGAMFAVFNSAVLALGGIIITYTLLVSTMNTAHEGQMLGQKWSSIWIPVRSTVGLALLIPKASGYCMMQIFVMWIVAQGIGAADKVWDAALNYLNRGGVIIQAQVNPAMDLLAQKTSGVAGAAQTILAGQVCMISLHKQLESQRQAYLIQKQAKSGPCYGTPTALMKQFCDTAVPDFIDSVNTIDVQGSFNPDTVTTNDALGNSINQSAYTAKMPNVASDSFYAALNGVCGEISWYPYTFTSDPKAINTIKSGDIETAKMSRAIAIQQMYLDLSTVAEIMVSNSPAFSSQGNGNQAPYAPMAAQQFGVPMTISGEPCVDSSTPSCNSWGSATGSSSPPLFNGDEFHGALADYNGIMAPTITLNLQAKNAFDESLSREFIAKARSQGWLLAGSYFFDLVTLNTRGGSGEPTLDKMDTVNTGLEASKFNVKDLAAGFTSDAASNTFCAGSSAPSVLLCEFFDKDVSKVVAIQQLINGTGFLYGTVPEPDLSGKLLYVQNNQLSSTVYGYVNNAMILQLVGQPGQSQMTFAKQIRVHPSLTYFELPEIDFPCWGGILCHVWERYSEV